MDPPSKRRKVNFTSFELEELVSEVTARKETLLAKYETNLTKLDKKKAWVEVTFAINAVSPTHRSVAEVRKKFVDFRSAVKKKLSERNRLMRATGKPTVVFDGINLTSIHPKSSFSWLIKILQNGFILLRMLY